MLKKEDIEYLATLARITISEEEKAELPGKLDPVLAYVSEISSVVTAEEAAPRVGNLRNVMREDVNPNPGGTFTNAILANAPRKEDGYFKVERIM